MNERSKALGAPVLFYGGGMPEGAWGRINPFCKQPLHSKKHAEKKGGKRRAHCRSAGAKGGRPKKAAAADVVLQQPAADLPVKGAAVLGRPPKKQDAAPRVRRADDQITCALLVGECPHGSPPAPGALFPAPFPLCCLHLLPSSCRKQSREAGPYDFQCNAFCLKREQESRWNKSLCF